MQFGLKYTWHPNHDKADKLADLLLGGFGAGGAFTASFSPTIGSILVGVGFFIKGLAAFTAEDDQNH